VNFNYLPHTDADRQEMLRTIGVPDSDALYHAVPASLRNFELEIPEGRSEWDVQAHVTALAAKNRSTSQFASFLGAGSYRRYLPAAVDWILHRSEFLTAYTPYQPEVSQGTLQAIYEFQTMICELTGMDLANASMYDASTATPEAAFMACRTTRREKVIVASTLHPEYREVLAAYAKGPGIAVEVAPHSGGKLDIEALSGMIDAQTACVILQMPNFLGNLEDAHAVGELIHAAGGLLVVVADPVSLGLLEAPGRYGADIVIGEAHQLGNPVSFGGPYVGYMACLDKFARQLPGRIVGETKDAKGQRVFTLTLQTREQHIRREKATSNICTNQALNALASTVYMTVIGKRGLYEVAHTSVQRAHALARAIAKVPGFSVPFGPHFNEFVVKSPVPVARLLDGLKAEGILGGVDLGRWYPELADCLLVSVTETNAPSELDRYAQALAAVASEKPSAATRA
jgi:glycine dehydrogenase subunit 1